MSLLPSTDGFSCVPTKFDSALVETPNKVDLIQTVAACELKESCYRVPVVEYYYETVYHQDGVKEERLKVGVTLLNHKCDQTLTFTFIFEPTLRGSIGGGGREGGELLLWCQTVMKYQYSSDISVEDST